MTEDAHLNPPDISPEMADIASKIRHLAQERNGDSLALLELLRVLEGIHREISDGVFQASFPTNRQALYSFLRDIETSGGWPYIYSRKMRVVLSELVKSLNEAAGKEDKATEG